MLREELALLSQEEHGNRPESMRESGDPPLPTSSTRPGGDGNGVEIGRSREGVANQNQRERERKQTSPAADLREFSAAYLATAAAS